jgi:hypothetical protein
MMDRREFLETVVAGGAAMALAPAAMHASTRDTKASYFGVHAFIESHPDAVFIMKTSVDVKTNETAIRAAGMNFGKGVFVPMTTPGIPLTQTIAIKPNIVMMYYTDVRDKGIVTDPNFVEGVIESLKLLGMSGSQMYMREVWGPDSISDNFLNSGYRAIAARTGVELKDQGLAIGSLSADQYRWVDVPNGVWFKRLPFLWPVNAPDGWLLNIAKLKTHSMGMSLSAKNIQGSIVKPYVAHCTAYEDTSWNLSPDHVSPDAKATILANYNRHVADRIPRWDRPQNVPPATSDNNGGLWMETWATRCLDTHSSLNAGLHIIEGVYGREGAFHDGPDVDGWGIDHMANMVIFGKNTFHVDTVGYWLGGHEPGNIGLLHMAIERGLSKYLNPMDIPVYEWSFDGTVSAANRAALTSFTRVPLRTTYLRRDYNGQTEDTWHLVNEPYTYKPASAVSSDAVLPKQFTLNQNYPNPFNPSTSIEFTLPRSGSVRLEVFDAHGQIVDVLANGYHQQGAHLLRWNGSRHASGVYFYRMLFEGTSVVKSMVLIR